MKKRFYLVYYITLLILFICMVFALHEINTLEIRVQDLEERTLNHEYRLEDIMPNDDIPHHFSSNTTL